jgi:eukaryotic-like serine/threonine-protein kinase
MSVSDSNPEASGKSPSDPTASFRGTGVAPVVAAPASWPQFPDHEILGQLGAGGMGVVYRARDRQRDTVVALKTLLHYGATDLYRFKQEFRALADLSHPNLVMLYQLLSTGDQWYFTMELVEGQDFLWCVRQAASLDTPTAAFDPLAGSETAIPTARTSAPAHVCDEGRLRETLRQLCEGLNYLHARDKLHCDLKPSNVMVEHGGRVVILDFGLVQEGAEPPVTAQASGTPAAGPDPTADMSLTWTRGDAIRGTIGYMSPEQAAGRQLSPASDWYAVGVMLYQALTGRLPFRGGFEVLQQKQKHDPPPPSALVAHVPPDLEALCMELLRRDPASRPGGLAVFDRLGGKPSEEPVALAATSAASVVFVGRDVQLALLRQAATDAAAGHARLVLVPGSSGAGKSTLLQRFFSELSAGHNTLILQGRCYEQESVPFKAIDALIDHLSHAFKAMPDAQVAELLPEGTATLAQMFPVLQRVSAVAAAASHGSRLEGQELRRQAFTALRTLLTRLASMRPLALWVDDLQWGDLDSAELLASLLQGPEPPPILFVLSYRGKYVGTSDCLRALFQMLKENAEVLRQEVPVEPLTVVEALDLARQLLGLTGSAKEAERIARESSGNPYFIHELVLHARAGDEQTGAAEKLDEVIWSRVCRLPEAARGLLEVLAVAGQPLQQGIACQVSSLHGDERRSMALLRSANLVRGSGPRPEDEVETFHDRIRESVRAHLSHEVLRRHHEHLALTLESVPGTAPERLANHFAEAGQPARAGTYFAQAGETAAKALAFDLAASLFRQALAQGTADEAATRRLRQQLGEALANAGRGAEAAEAYLSAAEGADAATAIDLRRQAAYQYCSSGHPDEGRAALRIVLESVGMKLPHTPLQSLTQLLWRRFRLWWRGLKFKERAASEVPAEDLRRVDVTWSTSTGLTLIDLVGAASFQTQNLLLALDAGEPFRLARALAWEAGHSSNPGLSARKRTDTLVARATELAERLDSAYLRSLILLTRGIGEWCYGQWMSSSNLLDQAESLFQERCTGVAWELGTTRSFIMWAFIYRGEFALMSQRATTLRKDAEQRGDLYTAANIGTYPEAVCRLADDEPEEARRLVRHCLAPWSQSGYHVQHMTATWGEVYTHLYLGEGLAAWKRIDEQWPLMRKSHLLRVQMIRIMMYWLHGGSALACTAAGHEPKAMLRAAAWAVRKMEGERTQWGNALALLLSAGIANRGTEARRTHDLLAAAGDQLDAVEMRSYAAAARRRLGQLLGGEQGRSVMDKADAWMKSQAIKNPARMTALHAPGFAAD